MSEKPSRFTASISLGNVITILGMVVAFAVAWGTVGQSVKGLSDRSDQMAADYRALAGRLRVVETQQAAQAAGQQAILSSMEDIKRSQREMEGLMRELLQDRRN